ncbi:MAG: tocopherol cyclase family protein [Butyrivibrio sp.]|nr:tocopherol cyclase family protein [Butyrivibrio sp.]
MREYFKGYYFKCSDEYGNGAVALIPSLHTDGTRRRASLQIITDGNSYTLPYSDIVFGKRSLQIGIGKNRFSERGMLIDVCTDECRIKGRLVFGRLERIKYDIMGPFKYIPFMQCRHSVISMKHRVDGRLDINGRLYRFENGCGYIEGDRGRSFPQKYIWTQCCFGKGSLMLAVAKIPFCGMSFNGIIGVVMLDGKEYRLATYLGARLVRASDNEVLVKQGKYALYAKQVGQSKRGLKAPVNGKMTRTIYESVECEAYYRFTCGGRVMLELVGKTASFEYEM